MDRAAQTAGFTLDEIATLLAFDSADRSAAQTLAQSRIDALDAKIAILQTMRSALLRLAEACAAGETGPCPIIAAFNPETAGK